MFGHLGNAGSSLSSSSNLSPLAPPFTVDRLNSKPNLSPLSSFNETPPPYGVPFSSALHNWQYPNSSAPGNDYCSSCDLKMGTLGTTVVPPVNDHCYSGSEPLNPPSLHWSPPNPNTMVPTSNPFSYGNATKQYYPTYVSQVGSDNASVAGLGEGNYDLLSTSGLVPMDGPSQVDYNQGLSSLEFTPPWSGFWNGFSDGKRGKRTDIDGNFHLEETDFSVSHAYRDYLNRETVPTECVRCEDNPSITRKKYADGHGIEANAGFLTKRQLDSNFVHNLRFGSSESSKAHNFGTSTMLKESHLDSPSLEPVTNSSNHQESNGSHEKGFQLFDSCSNNCISVRKTSVVPVTRPPVFGTKFPVPDAVASIKLDIGDTTDHNKDFRSFNQVLEKEPLLYPNSELTGGFLDATRLGLDTSKNDLQIFSAASSSIKEMKAEPPSKYSLDETIKLRGGKIHDINVSPGFTLPVEGTEAFKHTSNTTESSDQHNPAEDSPCWKGAPALNVTTFKSSEPILPQNVLKNLEACDGLDFKVAPVFHPYNESLMSFSGEPCGPSLQNLLTNSSKSVPPLKNVSANFTGKEKSASDAAILNSDSVLQNRNNRGQYSSNVEDQIKQYNLLNIRKSDFDSIQSHGKEVYFTSNSNILLQAGDVDAEISCSDTSESGYIPLCAVENVLCSSPSEIDDVKPPALKSSPRLNVQTLASALHNISELFVLNCSLDDRALSKQDFKTLQDVINNLNKCLLMDYVQSHTRKESSVSKAGISHIPEGAAKVRLHAMKEVGKTSVEQLESFSTHEQKKIDGVSHEKVMKYMDYGSSKNDAEVTWHQTIVQNIKKVLDENFQSEEEISSETLLYKNLWLNAEAELCVSGLKSRFDQAKIQMENRKSGGKKEDPVAVDKICSFKVSPDPIINVSSGFSPGVNDSPKQKTSVHCSCISSPMSNVNDAEASVMARLEILKCRDDNINTSNGEEKSLPDGTEIKVSQELGGSQTGNKSFNEAVGSRIQGHSDRGNEKNIGSSSDDSQHKAVEEFNVYVSDKNIRIHNQFASGPGWYDGTTLDWEHVLKEDYTWKI